ncbi:MAG TPA: efflux RND transporter permease subunit [Candidatus Fimivivens faecavium]|nr:efflux RND transporter permease subunit [Candidatus Fimivivens faecavium]
MSITKLAVKRPVSALMCVLVLVVFGVSSVFSMPLESTPEMSMPVYMVSTSYSGAGPEDVDELITDPIESALSTVSDVESMTSRSSEGRSMTTLEFDYNVDLDEKKDEIEEALGRVRLPDDAGDPMLMEMSMDSSSVMSLSIRTEDSDNLLTYVEDSIVPEFEKISGVAEVEVRGGKRNFIKVELKEDELLQYGLTMNSIVNAISTADFNQAAGSINRGDVGLTLRGGADYNSYDELGNIPISLPSGDLIRLDEVADITLAEQEETSISRYNGMKTISISISKNQSANTVTLCNRILAVVEELNSQNIGFTLEVEQNSGEDIMDNIASVISSLILGMAVSMFVLFFFLGDIRASAIVATSMPLSIFAALVMMAVSGMSINLLSLAGLVVGVGMIVDNSIVVLESCFRMRDEERTFKESAVLGAELVNNSVIASTITTIVVFLPIAIMGGMSGQLFKDVGYTIVYAMTASLISALTLIPLLFIRLEPIEKKNTPVSRVLSKLEKAYAKFLRKSFNFKKLVILVAVGVLVFSGFLFSQIGMELMPNMDQGSISITVTTKPGMDVEAVDAILLEMESRIAEYDQIESYSVRSSGGGSASISIRLKDDIGIKTAEMLPVLRERFSDILDCSIEVSERSGMSFGGNNGVTIRLTGPVLSDLEDAAAQLETLMAGYDGIIGTSSSVSDGDPQAEIKVDAALASAYGFTPSSVLSTVSSMIQGVTATTITEGGEEYSVDVMYPEGKFENVSDLSGLLLTSGDQQIPLTDIAEIVYSNAPTQIQRSDGDYVVSVTGQVEGKNTAALSAQIMAAASQTKLPDGVSVLAGGDMQTMNDEFSKIGYALLTAVFLVFVVMAMEFESTRFSLVVMISVPFSLTGAFLGLWVMNSSINMTSLIGLIMLVGTVVNNAIVLIDYTNILRNENGMVREDALVLAGRTRLRPILMTTLTTVLSLLPTAMGIGGDVEMMQSLSYVVIGGLSCSTFLTLILIPTFYIIFDKKPKRKKPRRSAQKPQPPELPAAENPVQTGAPK